MNETEENSEKFCTLFSIIFVTNSIRDIGLLFKEVKSDFKFQEPTLKQQFLKILNGMIELN